MTKCSVEFVSEQLRDQFPRVSIVSASEDRNDRDTEAWQFDCRLTFATEHGTYVKYVVLGVNERGLDRQRKERALELLAVRAAQRGAVKCEIYEVWPPPTPQSLRELAELNDGVKNA